MEVPLNHPFWMGFSMKSTIQLGSPMAMEIPILSAMAGSFGLGIATVALMASFRGARVSRRCR